MATTTTITTTGDTTTVTDGTGRIAVVCIVGVGDRKWGVGCSGDPACKVTIIGYARRGSAVTAAEWHLRWHRNGKPRCADCGRDLGRKGARRCRPDTCEAA